MLVPASAPYRPRTLPKETLNISSYFTKFKKKKNKIPDKPNRDSPRTKKNNVRGIPYIFSNLNRTMFSTTRDHLIILFNFFLFYPNLKKKSFLPKPNFHSFIHSFRLINTFRLKKKNVCLLFFRCTTSIMNKFYM